MTYTVDGTWTVVHVRAIPDDMKLVASDLTPDGSAITLDWLALGPYTSAGTFESRVFDAGDTRTVWGALTQTGSATGIAFDTRSSIDGTTFSDWAPVGAAARSPARSAASSSTAPA